MSFSESFAEWKAMMVQVREVAKTNPELAEALKFHEARAEEKGMDVDLYILSELTIKWAEQGAKQWNQERATNR